MSPTRLALDQLVLEQKRFWRNPANAIFTVAFPIFFLVIFGSLNMNDRLHQLGNINFNQFFTPNIVAFGVMSAFRRDTGLLKRMRGTPLPIPAFVFGLLASAFLGSALLTAFVMSFGAAAYNVDFPLQRLPELVLVLVVGAASFSALGIAIASLVPNADAGPAIVNAIFFPLVFLSGTFFPVGSGSVLAKIASVFPVRPFLQAIFATFDPLEIGSRLHWGDLAVVAGWGAVGAVVAVRRFRWEPRVT